jgi:hypothetical protein
MKAFSIAISGGSRGPPRPRPPLPHSWTRKKCSLVPILKRYTRPGLAILNSKFHRTRQFEQCNFCRKSTISCRSMLRLPNLPRIVGRQNNRKNVPARTPEEYCRRVGLLAEFCIQVFKNFPWVTRQLPKREESVTA